MKTRVAYMLSWIFILALMSAPLHAEVTKVEGRISGEMICLYEWTTDRPYQGSDAKCLNPEHTRALVADDGTIYILEPADNASEWLVDAIKTNVLERKQVVVKGEIITGGVVNIIKVSSIMLK